MFTGFISKKASFDNLEANSEKFSFLGHPKNISEKDAIFSKSSTFYVQETKVKVFVNSKKELFLNFSYSFSPNFLSWLLGICFFPLGFLIFIIPNRDKDDFEYFLNTYEL